MGYTTNEVNSKLSLGMDEIQDGRGDVRFWPSGLIPADQLDNPDIFRIASKKDITESIEKVLENTPDQRETIKNTRRQLSKQLNKVIKVVRKYGVLDTNVLLTNISEVIEKDKDTLGGMCVAVYKVIFKQVKEADENKESVEQLSDRINSVYKFSISKIKEMSHLAPKEKDDETRD